MKLIYAIVSNDDSSAVSSALTKVGFFATKLSSTGGFLMAGNTTFMICTDDEKVDEAISIISQKSRKPLSTQIRQRSGIISRRISSPTRITSARP